MNKNKQFNLTQFKDILATLQQDKSLKNQNGFLMLRANYEADDMEISTGRLAKAAGYDNYNTANEQYGSFAHKICDELGFNPQKRSDGSPIWTNVLCTSSAKKDSNGHFQWKLRPEVAVALEQMGLVNPANKKTLLDDLADKKENLANYTEKDRETIIKARIGQGEFRKRLINYWGGCAVTGCDCTDILIASHIKPWRDCIGKEAIDQMNGLLLLPNLDKPFDRGFISFEDSGRILLSSQLDEDTAKVLGITAGMKISKFLNYHKPYLEYHRKMVFKGIQA
ncbi:MAG: hypothetical protein ACI8PB_004396 [Desulforhopalus sp.]|jgi:hypothetical protein